MAPIAAVEAFERQVVVLPLAKMLVLRPVDARTKRNRRYKRIAQSIDEVGLVEPLVVCSKPDKEGRHLLLDGHLRRAALLDKGQSEARCLLSRSDEAFTYNARINRVAAVQEHLMIVRALERGVPEDKLASALNVNVQHVRADKAVNPVTFDALRKMKPNRQLEACDLMASASNFSFAYATALLTGSKRRCEKAVRSGAATRDHGCRPGLEQNEARLRVRGTGLRLGHARVGDCQQLSGKTDRQFPDRALPQ